MFHYQISSIFHICKYCVFNKCFVICFFSCFNQHYFRLAKLWKLWIIHEKFLRRAHLNSLKKMENKDLMSTQFNLDNHFLKRRWASLLIDWIWMEQVVFFMETKKSGFRVLSCGGLPLSWDHNTSISKFLRESSNRPALKSEHLTAKRTYKTGGAKLPYQTTSQTLDLSSHVYHQTGVEQTQDLSKHVCY